jgi:hypothetical protein
VPGKSRLEFDEPETFTPRPLTCTRRSAGVPSTLIWAFGCTLNRSPTRSVLGAATVTLLPLFTLTLQNTYWPPSSSRVPPLIVSSPYVPGGSVRTVPGSMVTASDEHDGKGSGSRQRSEPVKSDTSGGCGAGMGWTGWHCPAPLPELAKSAAQVEGWVRCTVEAATTPSCWFSVTTLLPWSVPPP